MVDVNSGLIAEEPAAAPEPAPPLGPEKKTGAGPTESSAAKETWAALIGRRNDAEVKLRFAEDTKAILQKHGVDTYCCLGLMEPEDSLDAFDLDQIYEALESANPKKERDVLLVLLSHGGVIEPAYQISKLCKTYAKDKFVVAVPRQAKSAATLVALGADEIHMSILGQLGPIDPQLGGLPALGVQQALQRIAALSEKFPGSAEMFAKYLRQALTVEQIGYCERIAESAEQYAQRLLKGKPSVAENAADIARDMVHTYKDHGFVIDLVEAREHLGKDWVRDGTPEVHAAEELYKHFNHINFLVDVFMQKRLLALGELGNASDVFMWRRRS